MKKKNNWIHVLEIKKKPIQSLEMFRNSWNMIVMIELLKKNTGTWNKIKTTKVGQSPLEFRKIKISLKGWELTF